MFDKWLNVPAHLYLRITALTILTVGIALSNVLMSIGAIWIIANWLIQGDFKLYWNRFKSKTTVWIVVILFLLLAVSLLWSTDVNYGFKDLRVKLPFLVIPLVMGTSEPLQKKHFHFLLYVFLGIMLYTSVYNYVHYNYVLENATDIRKMSVFISHVRYAILINFALFIPFYLAFKGKLSYIFVVPLVVWFLFYLYTSQVINGYLLFVILCGVALFWWMIKAPRTKIKWIVGGAVVTTVVVVGLFLMQWISGIKTTEKVVYSKLELYTAQGNPYFHDTTNHQLENGNLVWVYVNQQELEQAWNKRSSIHYFDEDKKGQPLFGTLMRYLTSKGLRKDAAGVNQLTAAEVREIENGRTSIAVNDGLKTRLAGFLMEYQIYKDGGDPNGNSLIQRLEHIKAACGILASHWLTGVGVGDVPNAFTVQYANMNSKLIEENQHRSHNQFLTLWVSLGIIGLILFVLLLIIPFFEIEPDFFTGIVLSALIVACLFQDVIETQAGVTIFALFYSLALYRNQQSVNHPEAH